MRSVVSKQMSFQFLLLLTNSVSRLRTLQLSSKKLSSLSTLIRDCQSQRKLAGRKPPYRIDCSRCCKREMGHLQIHFLIQWMQMQIRSSDFVEAPVGVVDTNSGVEDGLQTQPWFIWNLRSDLTMGSVPGWSGYCLLRHGRYVPLLDSVTSSISRAKPGPDHLSVPNWDLLITDLWDRRYGEEIFPDAYLGAVHWRVTTHSMPGLQGLTTPSEGWTGSALQQLLLVFQLIRLRL